MFSDIVFGGFVVFLLVQLGYSMYFFGKIAFYKDDFNSGEHKSISIIVCAHNELENLKKLIPAILAQNYHQYEFVIVNDRSFDGTEEYLKEKYIADRAQIKVVTIEETPAKMDPKKYALTLGIKAASHQHLLFTDADCLPYNDKWLLQMQSKYGSNNSIILGISQYLERKGFLNLLIRYETFYTTIQYLSFALRGMPYMGVGRNLAYTKQMFFDNKGFHPFMDITGGDDDLFIAKIANSKNVRIATSIECQTVSEPKHTWRDWYLQKTRHLSVGKHYNPKFKYSLSVLNLSHLLVLIFFIVSLIDAKYFYLVLIGYFLRMLLNLTFFSLIITKLRYKFNFWLIPIFDLIYPIYYNVVGANALLSKKIRWK